MGAITRLLEHDPPDPAEHRPRRASQLLAEQNPVPWAALEGGVLMEQEIGHFEPCASLANPMAYTASPAGQTFTDAKTAQTCAGGFEGAGKTGEGPCDPSTGVCQNVSTQAGTACPSDNFMSGALCEFSDMTCCRLARARWTSTGRWPS